MRTVLALGLFLLPCLIAGCTWIRNMTWKPSPEEWRRIHEEVEATRAIDKIEISALHEQLYEAGKEQVVLTLGKPDPKFIFKENDTNRLKKGSTYEFATVEEQKIGNYDEIRYTERWAYDKESETDIGDPPRRHRWRSLYYVYFLNDKVVLVR